MAIVESVVQLLLQKLGDPLIKEVIFLNGVRNQVEVLQTEFRRMQCFLEDADDKQGDRRVKNWVRDVRDVAYDAEDVIDTFVFKIATLKRRRFAGRVRRYAFIFNELIALHKVGSEIKRINNKIRLISESRLTYGIENIGQGAGMSSSGRSLQDRWLTSPDFGVEDFVGFENDSQTLISRLMDTDPRLRVVSVVGMGGLGKTTLTKKVYNDEYVKRHFEIRAWISVSQEYDVRDLLQSIINSYMVLSEEELRNANIIQLKYKIFKFLVDKRFLIVIDDLWTNEAWDDLKDAFPDMGRGSRVMLTTRNKEVALYADAQSWPHELQFLNLDDCWLLFCAKAFPGEYNSRNPELENLGREIVEKCCRLPLAIVTIAEHLSGKKERREWENVLRNISWQMVDREVKISRRLFLSYRDLPHHLKSCFLYLAIFPENYEFSTKKVIRLWAAEGLLQRRKEQTLEEVGEDCLKELVQRSMVQVSRRSSSGGIKSCLIHNLLRDVSISKAKEDGLFEIHSGNVDSLSTSTARRLAIYQNDINEHAPLKSYTPYLRSVLIYTQIDENIERTAAMFPCRGFKLLRVLDLHNVAIEELPREISALIHLRYLGCTNTWLKRLPSSIGNLHNLQTLTVTSFHSIKVPSTIEKMRQLRHFQVKSACNEVSNVSFGAIEGRPQLDRLTNLQTLSYVKAGDWMYGLLGKPVNLRKLGIHLDDEGAFAEVLYASFERLNCLQSLFVMGRQFPSLAPLKHFLKLSKLRLHGKLEKLPEYYEFPRYLTKLTLECSGLEQDPLATLERVENLQILRLLQSSYEGKEMACSVYGFPQLVSLHLEGLFQLEYWRVEEGSMRNLLHLRISNCPELKMLPEGLSRVGLRNLELWGMPPLFQARLDRYEGEDWPKIHHIPYIDMSQ